MDVEFLKKEAGSWTYCEESEAEAALIPIESYHGYEKALRILNDRAKQQIKPAPYDDHGYQTIRAEAKKYRNGNYSKHYKVFEITKNTPFSASLSLEEASDQIKLDLHKYYHYPTAAELQYNVIYHDNTTKTFTMSYSELSHGILEYYADPQYFTKTRILESKITGDAEKYTKIKELAEKYNNSIIYSIEKFRVDYGRGVYSVTYMATGTI